MVNLFSVSLRTQSGARSGRENESWHNLRQRNRLAIRQNFCLPPLHREPIIAEVSDDQQLIISHTVRFAKKGRPTIRVGYAENWRCALAEGMLATVHPAAETELPARNHPRARTVMELYARVAASLRGKVSVFSGFPRRPPPLRRCLQNRRG